MRTRVRGPRDREDVEGWMKAILSMIRRDSSGELLRLITCVLARVLGRTGRTLGGGCSRGRATEADQTAMGRAFRE
jgi:hypothetical protein